ncbi:hypothetical protein ACMGDM_07930 [Sphingomonas sp. DT-51]
MTVIVRTHGGLGNQLFQILYGRLTATQIDTRYGEIHDRNYAHRFERSAAIPLPDYRCSPWQRAISRARLPKVLRRLRLRSGESLSLFGSTYLDGYFQDIAGYRRFTVAAIAEQIGRLGRELEVERHTVLPASTIYHLRLGDFFNDRRAALAHLLDRLDGLDTGVTVITNQEDLFELEEVRNRMAGKGCRLQSTAEHSAEDVIRLMSTYGTIVTNDSTLALWASLLSGARTEFANNRLAQLHQFLYAAAHGTG